MSQLLYLDVYSIKANFSIISSTFHVHAVLKLAPVLLPKSQGMQVVRIICTFTKKNKGTVTIMFLFYFMILITTMLPFNGNSMISGEGSCITHC